MNTFLPKDYKVPSSSQFMNIEIGDNKLRILSEAVIGWEGWKAKKPFRIKAVVGESCPIKDEEVDLNNYGRPNINHFWAFAVWNYKTQKVEVLEVTQKTIMQAVENYFMAEEWGDPREYDLNIKKLDEGGKIKYLVTAMPPKPLSSEIGEQYEKSSVDLEKLFAGEYPMTGEPDPKDTPF